MKNKIRVLLCGVIFGQVYLKGVLNNNDYQLCGILSTGSEYSRKIAAKYHVSLYTKIDEVSSDNFDLALVVIRSGIVGGEGNKVTQQLLNKGISVIQEQPVHSEEAIENYKIALKNNIFYSNFKQCPNEVKGEIYIGGLGLASGYYGDECRTI